MAYKLVFASSNKRLFEVTGVLKLNPLTLVFTFEYKVLQLQLNLTTPLMTTSFLKIRRERQYLMRQYFAALNSRALICWTLLQQIAKFIFSTGLCPIRPTWRVTTATGLTNSGLQARARASSELYNSLIERFFVRKVSKARHPRRKTISASEVFFSSITERATKFNICSDSIKSHQGPWFIFMEPRWES